MIEPLAWDALKLCLGSRARDAHKGDFGHVVIVGGDVGMPGAVRLAGEAALRVGAGLVSVVTRTQHIPVVSASRPELMCHPEQQAETVLARATVVAVGPGLGRSDWSNALLQQVLALSCPLVVDADALNLLAATSLSSRPHWILTPHPGEAARLLATDTAQIHSNRIAAVTALQKRWGGVAVLKGQGTLIRTAEKIYRCDAGNPGMASAGMGDVLTGVISGLLAQGLDLSQAAQLGVLLHAKAGDTAAQSGERGLIASDVIAALRSWVNV